MEHILKIRLQLEELKPGDIEKNLQKPSEGIEKAIASGMEKGAVTGGAAMIERMTTLQKAWKEFDWSHPIQSIKNLFSGVIDWIKNRFGVLGGILIAVIAGAINLIRKLLEPQAILVKTFAQLSYQTQEMIAYGTTFGDRVGKAMRQVAEVALVTGENMTDVANRFAQLAQMRVPIGEVKGLTQAAYLGAKALGANVDQMTEFVGTLRVMGRLNSDQIMGRKGIIQSFSSIQDAVGLTEREMTGLIQTTTELTRHMQAFGATADSIVNMAEATAKLTGLFGQLGLGADRAGEIMNKLFDPTQLGENAYLIRSMGFSMQEYLDMLAGGEVDQRKLTGGLIEAAKEIEDMQQAGVHVMALQQRAQMMGFRNAAEALRLAKEGPNILRDMEKATEAGVDYEKRAAEGMATLNDALGRVKNRFMAFFGKMAAPLIENLTKFVAKLEEKWIKNESVIKKFAETFTDKLVDFVDKFDFNKVLEWFDRLGTVLKWVTTHLKTIAVVAGVAASAFIGFKVLGTIAPMVTQFSGAIGGLTKGLKGLGTVGKGVQGATQGMSTFMKFLMKAAIGVGILLLLAGAIWILAQAFKTFTKDVDWKGMLKAIVAIAAITAVMIGLGLFFATPVGMAAIAGALAFGAALLVFSAGLLVLAIALKKFGDATESIEKLASIASPELAKNLAMVGIAIAGFVKQFGFLQLLKAPLLILLGAAIKQFAIGLWVLGEVKNVRAATDAMEAIGNSIKVLSEGRFKNNAIVIGETMKALSESLMTLSQIKPEAFSGLAPAMGQVAVGFKAWMDALTGDKGIGVMGTIGRKLAESVTKYAEIGKAFKELAIGIWVLGEAKTSNLENIPNLVASLGKALPIWDSRDVRKGAAAFTDFVKEMASAPPIKLATDVQAAGTAKLTTEITGETKIVATIQKSITDEIGKVVIALNGIFDSQWKNAQLAMGGMASMATTTGIKTRSV
jgi:hypothetical protein